MIVLRFGKWDNLLLPEKKIFLEGIKFLAAGMALGLLIQVVVGIILVAFLAFLPGVIPFEAIEEMTGKSIDIEKPLGDFSKAAKNTTKKLPDITTKPIRSQVSIFYALGNSIILSIFIVNSMSVLSLSLLPEVGTRLDPTSIRTYRVIFPKFIIFVSGLINIGLIIPLLQPEKMYILKNFIPHGTLEFIGILLAYSIPREGGIAGRWGRLAMAEFFMLIAAFVEGWYSLKFLF